MSLNKSLVFLSISEISSLDDSGIYPDLLREFVKDSWQITIFYGSNKKAESNKNTESDAELIPVHIPKYEKSNVLKKGYALLRFDEAFRRAIEKRNLERVDLILYPTPPITITRTVAWVKGKYCATSYLLLKDIFPQNALDMRMLSKFNPFYFYFRLIEKKLYSTSDAIGCMSPANMNYMTEHYSQISEKIELNPNSVDISRVKRQKYTESDMIRRKYKLSHTSKLIVYGGNLGIPQGISFLKDFIEFTSEKRQDIEFVVAGSGTQSYSLKNSRANNLHFLGNLGRDEFDKLVAASDVGLVSLDARFTIPNFPSRLLTYLSNSLPVLCLVDKATDVGEIAERNGFGISAENGDLQDAYRAMTILLDNRDYKKMGRKGREYLESNYNTRVSYKAIVKHIKNN